MNGHSFHDKKAQKVIIYWDYENCPIPNQATTFGNVWNVIKRRIFKYLSYPVQVEGKVYIAAQKLPNKLKQEMDICSAKNIDIPSWKPEAVDKRMLVDLALDLYEWKGHNICNAVVLISGDKDFGNILGRIHNAPEIAKLILIRLPRNDGKELPVNKNLYTNLDYIIDSNHGNGFAVTEFIDCRFGMNCNQGINCKYYHHDMHHNNYVHQNSPPSSAPNAHQSPASSISNASVSSSDHNDDQKDIEMNQKTLEIRSKITCRFGNNCNNWKKGDCHFFHERPYVAPKQVKPQHMAGYKKTCNFGQECRDWKKGPGHCKFYHSFPYVAPNQPQPQHMAASGPPPPNPVQQQLHQQQDQDVIMRNNNGNIYQIKQAAQPNDNKHNLDIIPGDIVWNAYIDKKGAEALSAQFLLNFSKQEASLENLNYKTAKATFARNKGKGRM